MVKVLAGSFGLVTGLALVWLGVLPWPLEIAVRTGRWPASPPRVPASLLHTHTRTVGTQPQAGALQVLTEVPGGAWLVAVTSTVQQAFPAAGGLTGLAIGDGTLVNRFGTVGLAAGASTTVTVGAPMPETLVIAPVGGPLPARGAIALTLVYLGGPDAGP